MEPTGKEKGVGAGAGRTTRLLGLVAGTLSAIRLGVSIGDGRDGCCRSARTFQRFSSVLHGSGHPSLTSDA